MNMNKNIARLAVTAGLTAALSFGGVMAPVTMAFAAEGDNSITINKIAEENKDNTFKAYQIFKAKVVDEKDKGKVTSDIEWSSTTIGSKVIAAIKQSAKYKEIVQTDSTNVLADDAAAPVVAEWLAKNVTGTSASSEGSKGTRVAPGDVLYEIAKGVADETPVDSSIQEDTPWTRPDSSGDGYYLFVTNDLQADKPNTGTSPIFAIVGGSPVTVTEKTSIPTVTKKVKDDKPDSTWADKADSQMGQKVQYQLTGSVADNVDTFNTYYYKFHDELSAGLTADQGSIQVYAVTNGTTTNIEANKYKVVVADDADTGKSILTVEFTDLKNAVTNLSKDTKIFVEYTAMLDVTKAEKVTVGGEGNENTVKLIYSNNPGRDSKGESVPDTVRDYTYALKLIKEDSADENTKLEGVRFTIQATNPDDSESNGKYVQKFGSLDENSYEFTTDAKGEISIKGLDAGTYTVKETKAHDGYNTLPDFKFTISTADGDLDKTDEQAKTVTVNTTTEGSELVAGTQTDGTVTLTVKNKKGSGLPLTGLNGVTFTWVAGGAVLCIGVAHLIRSRKQAEESEQE